MRKAFRPIVTAALVLTLSPTVTAQTPVYLGATAEDSVGSRLVYAMKEKIRRSAGITLVDRDQDGRIKVQIVTLDPDNGEYAGRRTIYSVVWTAKTFHDTPVDMFLTNSVGLCGTSRVQECADGLVADTDSQAARIRTLIQNAVERTQK